MKNQVRSGQAAVNGRLIFTGTLALRKKRPLSLVIDPMPFEPLFVIPFQGGRGRFQGSVDF